MHDGSPCVDGMERVRLVYGVRPQMQQPATSLSVSTIVGAATGAFAVGSGARHDVVQLLGVVGSLAQTFIEGRSRKEKAKSKIMQTAVDNDSKWELIMAESTKGSWRDELITVAVRTTVLSFIPGMEEVVKQGLLGSLSCRIGISIFIFTFTILARLGLKGVDKFRKK